VVKWIRKGGDRRLAARPAAPELLHIDSSGFLNRVRDAFRRDDNRLYATRAGSKHAPARAVILAIVIISIGVC
jgi:hypothetical protein